jgi:aryl-alcohol dehydrogenase-like predicted oxidoreductase
MEYTKLGRTGLDVSRICLGCMSYGGGNLGNHAWSLPEDESRPFIKKALEVVIATKVNGRMHPGLNSAGLSRKVAKPRCLRVESQSSAAKLRRLSRNRRKYGHAPAAAPRCPSKPSAASQACCIAIS